MSKENKAKTVLSWDIHQRNQTILISRLKVMLPRKKKVKSWIHLALHSGQSHSAPPTTFAQPVLLLSFRNTSIKCFSRKQHDIYVRMGVDTCSGSRSGTLCDSTDAINQFRESIPLASYKRAWWVSLLMGRHTLKIDQLTTMFQLIIFDLFSPNLPFLESAD